MHQGCKASAPCTRGCRPMHACVRAIAPCMRACVPSLLKVANPYPYPYPTPNPTPNPLPKAAFRALGWGGRFLVVGFASGGAAPKAAIPRLPLNLALLNERRVAQHVVSPACRLGGAATHLPGLLGLTTVCRYPAARRSRTRRRAAQGRGQEECRRSAGGVQEERRRLLCGRAARPKMPMPMPHPMTPGAWCLLGRMEGARA